MDLESPRHLLQFQKQQQARRP